MKWDALSMKKKTELFDQLANEESSMAKDGLSLMACIPDKDTPERAEFVKLWRRKDSLEEFKYACRTNELLKNSQFTAKLWGNDWYFLRNMLGERCRKTSSDAGSLKIGFGKFTMLIPNGYGDGVTRWAVLREGDFLPSCFNFLTSIECAERIDIYTYDCGSVVGWRIKEGRYGIYYAKGFVIFSPWK